MNDKSARQFERYVNFGALILVLLACAMAMSPSVADPDLWGHVQYGFDVLDTGEISETTTYSYTAEGYRWINHENLSEIVMALTVRHLGSAGLLIGKFLLSLLVIGTIIWFNIRQKVSLAATSLVALLVAANLGYHWSFRPQVSSFVLFTMLVLLLQMSFANWRDRWNVPQFLSKSMGRDETGARVEQSWFNARLLWLAPVILVVWTNSHGGYVAGVCIFIAYLVCRAFEALCVKGTAGKGLVLRMGLMAVVAGLVTLINPYSFRLPMWLLESLGSPRPEISDWSSRELFNVVGFKFWALLAVVAFAFSYSKKSLDFTQMVVLAVTLWQAVSHFRHVPFFAILCGFWIGPHLSSALARLQGVDNKKSVHNAQLQNTGAPLGASNASQGRNNRKGRFAVGLVMLFMFGVLSFSLYGRMTQLKVDRSRFPVDAFEYIASEDLGRGQKIVVTYDWAQYTIAAFCCPDKDGTAPSRVAFDGRFRTCYPQEVVDMHFDFLYGDEVANRHRSPNSPAIDPARVLKHGQPDLVVLERTGELTEKHMQQQTTDWVLLYQDAMAQVWGSRQKFDNPNSQKYRPPSRRNISNRIPTGYADWPALPIRKTLAKPHDLPEIAGNTK